VDLGKAAFATMAPAIMVFFSLASGWGESAMDVTAEGTEANLTWGAIKKAQEPTDFSPDGRRSADEGSNVCALESAPRQRIGTMREYLRRTPGRRHNLDLLGIEVDDDMDRFEGKHISGAEVINVEPSGPGALAGLRSQGVAINTPLRAITVVGTLALPPIAIAYVLIWEKGVGDWHDLIIGVDGERVRRVSDLENALEQMKEGDIVYLTLLRSGKRVQVPVSLRASHSK
jgi:PDZ domain